MWRPGKILILSLAGLVLAVGLFKAATAGFFGGEDAVATLIAGGGSVILGLVACYFVVASALATRGAALLRQGKDVIASWRVEPGEWERYSRVTLSDSGVSLPFLEALKYTRRKAAYEAPVEVICGKRGVLMDDCYFALAPGRNAGMEQAGMVLTDPPCLAFVLRAHIPGSGAIRIIRTLLLVPAPAHARSEAQRALRHYCDAIDQVRGFDTIVQANPRRARAIFWIALGASVAAAVTGIYLETIDYPGTWPDALGITGIMLTLATLLLGWLWRPRRA